MNIIIMIQVKSVWKNINRYIISKNIWKIY